jgi:hypothetical protein
VVPYEAVRWVCIGLATLSSGLFLLLNFRGPIFDVAGAKCALCTVLRTTLPGFHLPCDPQHSVPAFA